MKASNLQTAILIVILTSGHAHEAANAFEIACPEGYLLHYQGFCVSIDDKLPRTLNGEVKGTDPKEVSHQGKTHNNSQHDAGHKVPGERIKYKFSAMMFGEYCKTAYVQLSKVSGSGPAAMALGEESCGISGAGNETVADAEAEALEKCKSATIGCRIIFTTGYAPVHSDQTGSAEWIAACARKYRSFEPRTGLYTAHSGNKRRCRLP
ncbi:MAG: BA14K family protein [Hyphomicrobiales bacterium]|nr:BA14K family protein [Hyphomicrobiales bacterium]